MITFPAFVLFLFLFTLSSRLHITLTRLDAPPIGTPHPSMS